MNESQAVITLHDVARYVEHHIGKGELSKDIRKVADRLNNVFKMESKYGSKRPK
jgi:hypothetical protein